MHSCRIDAPSSSSANANAATSKRTLFYAAGKLLTAEEMWDRLGAGPNATVDDMVKAIQQEAVLVRELPPFSSDCLLLTTVAAPNIEPR
jgi:hypothetical protein